VFQVFAVILSAAKNPEELNTSQPLEPFPLCILPVIDQRSEGTHHINKVQLN